MQVQTRMSPLSPPSNQRSGHIRITPEAGEAILIKSAEDVTTHWEKLPQWLTHQLNQQDEERLPDILNRFAEKDNVILDLHPTHNAELKVPNAKTKQEEQAALFPWLTDVQNKGKSTFRRDNGLALDQIRPTIITAMSEEAQERSYSAYGHTPQVGESIENVLSTPAFQAIYGKPAEKVIATNATHTTKAEKPVSALPSAKKPTYKTIWSEETPVEAPAIDRNALIQQVKELFDHEDNSMLMKVQRTYLIKQLQNGDIPRTFEGFLRGHATELARLEASGQESSATKSAALEQLSGLFFKPTPFTDKIEEAPLVITPPVSPQAVAPEEIAEEEIVPFLEKFPRRSDKAEERRSGTPLKAYVSGEKKRPKRMVPQDDVTAWIKEELILYREGQEAKQEGLPKVSPPTPKAIQRPSTEEHPSRSSTVEIPKETKTALAKFPHLLKQLETSHT